MNKEIPKAYEPKNFEDRIYQEWEEKGFFNPDKLNLPKDAKAYSIVLPPPNVTGTLHMGHAGMLAIEDILIRFHRMKGERALWVPGTDHAAIATQTKVEKIVKEEGESRHSLGREKFLERVKEFAQQSHDTIVNQCKRMGASLDWSREAYTLDATREKAVRSVFKLMYDDGLIYRGERIVNWCPRCHSTLADDEVEYKDSKTKLYWLKYGPFVLATTRPETKLGDTAVAVHPSDERYKDMVGKKYMIPGVLGEFEITVVADRSVDPEFGSGAIKVTPAHSFVDAEIAERHGIAAKKIIDEDGRMMDNCGKYAGMTTKEAREAIVEDMTALGLIDHVEDDYANRLSICYRCDTIIEPLPSKQWFIDVNKKIDRNWKLEIGNSIDFNGKSIKELCLEVVRDGKIKIIPERFEKNYYHWMENLRDWCISRQIWFGHRVPIWYQVNSDLAEAYNSNPNSSHSSFTSKATHCEFSIDNPGKSDNTEDRWIPDTDTLDTWFSSGLWTFSTLAHSPEEIRIEDGRLVIDAEDFRKFHPTQVLETGYDILFFWVARMIIMTTYATGDIPFKDVYLHGLVLDEKGKKMSKSKGNVIDPLDMIAKYGTDATRLSLVIGSTPGADMRLSEEKVAGFRNLVNKIWNVSRYILSNQESQTGNQESGIRNQELNHENFTMADAWIWDKFSVLVKDVTEDLEKYQFSQAGEKLREFTWNDLADWYLEATKFLKSSETEKVLNLILVSILKLWHPFIPFVTEAIWSEMSEETMLIVESWPDQHLPFAKGEAGPALSEAEGRYSSFEEIKNIITSIRNARSENKIEPSRKVKAVFVCDEAMGKVIKENEALIKGMRTGVGEIEILKKLPPAPRAEGEGAIKVIVGNFIIYLLGAKDEAKEKARLEKKRAELEKAITGLKAKLENKEFAERAPAAIVDKEKARLAALENELKEIGA